MASEEQVTSDLPGKAARRRPWTILLMGAIVVAGSMGLLRVGAWRLHKVAVLRQQYLEQGGEIDIPEALYYLQMWLEVMIPAFLIWLGLQGGAVVVFCCMRKGAGLLAGVGFWTLWIVALAMVVRAVGWPTVSWLFGLLLAPSLRTLGGLAIASIVVIVGKVFCRYRLNRMSKTPDGR